MTPCCPDIYPSLATLNLDFTWYRKNGSSYVKISDSETRRYNESWENSRHFETPPLFFPPKDVWETSAEFHSDDMSLPRSWVVLLICWKFASTNHEHYPGAGSDVKNNFDTQLEYVDLRDSVKQARDTWQKKGIWNETTPTLFPFPLVK